MLPDTEAEAEAFFVRALGDREAKQLIRQIRTWGAQRQAVRSDLSAVSEAA